MSFSLFCIFASCSNRSKQDTDYLHSIGSDYSEEFVFEESFPKQEVPTDTQDEIAEPDAERIKWDLQGQTFINPISGRYLRKITILRKEDISNLKIVSKTKDEGCDYVNYSVTATLKGEGYCTYVVDLDIAYNVREITGSKVTKGWIYYWTKVKKIDVLTANNNFKSCLEYHLTYRNLILKNICTNAIVVEGSITYSDHPQNFWRTLEAGGTDSITDIKDYKIEKVFRP